VTKSKPLAVSHERCHELLEICEPSLLRLEKESGLKWRVSRRGTAKAGDWAGRTEKIERSGRIHKYWRIKLDGKLYLASRIIYFMYHGVDPYPLEIDHKNRNSLDNTVTNLRLSDDKFQVQNRGMHSSNTSGVKGVYWDKRASKWRAYITVENKQKHLGLYTTLKEAAEARNAAIKKYWPEEVWEANLVDVEAL